MHNIHMQKSKKQHEKKSQEKQSVPLHSFQLTTSSSSGLATKNNKFKSRVIAVVGITTLAAPNLFYHAITYIILSSAQKILEIQTDLD